MMATIDRAAGPEESLRPGPADRQTFRGPRATYIAGCLAFIAIGALHTYVHATQLFGAELQGRFDAMGSIDVSGTTTASWDLFQGVSWLMGFFAIALGLANLGALRRGERPPTLNCVATIVMLASITIIGWAYLGPMQLFGGPFGIGLFGYSLLGGRSARR